MRKPIIVIGTLGVFAIIVSIGFLEATTRAEVSGASYYPCGQTLGCPTGLASYGYDNATGALYSVESNESIGYASINSIQANNTFSGSYGGGSPTLYNGSSLQLNDILVVNNTGGSQDYYWPQNILAFGNTSSKTRTVVFHDNVLNMSSASSMFESPDITSSNGSVVGSSSSGYYYGNYVRAPYFTLNLPYTTEQIIEVQIVSSGILLTMKVDIIQSGSSSPNRLYTYDTIIIRDPKAQSAYFYVDHNLNPAGYIDDSELVFSGFANGASTTFSAMNATIGLFYADSSGNAVPFPSYYSYGSDTGESTNNLFVKYLGSGYAEVATGSPYYGALTTGTSRSTTSISSTAYSTTQATKSSSSSLSTSTQSATLSSSSTSVKDSTTTLTSSQTANESSSDATMSTITSSTETNANQSSTTSQSFTDTQIFSSSSSSSQVSAFTSLDSSTAVAWSTSSSSSSVSLQSGAILPNSDFGEMEQLSFVSALSIGAFLIVGKIVSSSVGKRR